MPFNYDTDGDRGCDDFALLSADPVQWSCAITKPGDSHYRYFGFRENKTKLVNDDVMDIAINNWIDLK